MAHDASFGVQRMTPRDAPTRDASFGFKFETHDGFQDYHYFQNRPCQLRLSTPLRRRATERR